MRVLFVIAVLGACGDPDLCPPSVAPCTDTACLAERCEHGESAACAAAARALAASPLRADRQRAVHLHELACARGSAEDCNALANALDDGVYIDKDLVRAAALRTQLCDQGVANACYWLQSQYGGGWGVHRDEARADRLQWRACELGSTEACELLSHLRKPGLFQRAFDVSRTACHAGDAAACWSAYHIFTDRRPSPAATDVPDADWAAIAAAKTVACAAGDPDACFNLARLLNAGKGIRKDPNAAFSSYQRACELGSARSCLALGRGDDGRDMDVRACQLGDREACWRANPRDPAMLRAIFIRGCEVGAAHSCTRAMDMLDKGTSGPVDHAGARRLQSEACSQGYAEQCFALAREAHERGDLAAERALQRRACRAEPTSGGCRIYATLLRKACDDNDAASCQQLDRFLADLTPARRDLAAFACCREQRGIAASPAGQLAAFADALARHDAKAMRAFVHPRRGMKVRMYWEGRRDYRDRTFRVRTNSLHLDTLEGATPSESEIDAIDCPDAFEDDAATCTWRSEWEGGTYQLLRDRGRIYMLAIDVKTYSA